jgi:hypothetical protein
MVRLLITTLAGAAFVSAAAHAQSDAPSRQHLVAGVDISYVDASGLDSWTDGSIGKLRYDGDSDGLVISRAFVEYDTRLTDTISVNAVAEFYDDDIGSSMDLTEAYLEWRPVPRSANRYRLKLGAFYAPFSMENSGPAWSTPYTISSSAINTWFAEELRTIGAELSVSRRPKFLGGDHQFGIRAATFWVNDTAGGLLAWKGWSLHDRQTRLGDAVPLAPVPAIQPGGVFEEQDSYIEPFVELDGQLGTYLAADWRFGDRFQLTAALYDNHADPLAVEDGQWAWYTEFAHIGGKLALPGGFGLIGQWIRGSTIMGWVQNGAYIADVEFDSKFLLLTRQRDRHRMSVRYDLFDMTDEDFTAEDMSAEDGHALTVSYRYEFSDRITVAAEWLQIRTNRTAWEAYFGTNPENTEEQLQLSLMLRFSH